MRNISALLFALLVFISHAISAYSDTYIRSIDLVRMNVFDRQLEHDGNIIYRLANKFHVMTKERIIRQELLFDEKTSFNQEDLDESIRNIRALPFIGEAVYNIRQVSDDSVDIEIITEDLWTTAFGISGEGGGGRYDFTIYADEKNIAGMGIGIETNLQFTTDDNDGCSIHITDQRFLGTRFLTDLWLQDISFVNELSLLLYRPFYSLETRWSYSGWFSLKKTEPRIFYQGTEIFRYNHDYTGFNINARRAFGRHSRIEPGILFTYGSHDYSEILPDYPDNGLIPEAETFSGPGFDLKLTTRRYITAIYLDEFGVIEDLTEHISMKVGAIWSGPTFDGDYEAAYFNIESGFFLKSVDGIYAGLKNSYSNYFVGLNRERIVNRLESILYIKPSDYHLMALRFLSSFAWRQKSDYQLTLGGINGLRGYPDRYFEGTRLALLNAEYRIFTPIEILTVGIGGAAFFDAGYIWDDRQNISISDIKKDVGLGLRFGLTKSSTARIIRLDIARALDMDNWYLSFSTENLFGLARFQ